MQLVPAELPFPCPWALHPARHGPTGAKDLGSPGSSVELPLAQANKVNITVSTVN